MIGTRGWDFPPSPLAFATPYKDSGQVDLLLCTMSTYFDLLFLLHILISPWDSEESVFVENVPVGGRCGTRAHGFVTTGADEIGLTLLVLVLPVQIVQEITFHVL